LQAVINNNPKWKKLIVQKKMAVGVVDLSDPYHARYARLNGNVMMYAASLPKIAILLATMDALEKGEIEDSPELRASMRQMIAKSSNTASTQLIDLLGYEKIEAVLTDPKYDLYDEDYGGGLWVGKRYAKTGERHPDPLRGISHGATVTQVCRYYYLMAYGQLVSYNRSKEMLEYMDNPELNHKFVNILRTIAPKAHLYRKSGTWKTFHSDSVLVWGPERRYILVGLIDDPEGENILRDLVVGIDNMLKTTANQYTMNHSVVN
jgi:beta-lactamase class A